MRQGRCLSGVLARRQNKSYPALAALFGLMAWAHTVSAQSSVSITPGEPKEFPVWSGAAPGSEHWTQQETVSDFGPLKVTRNVTSPTITAYLPSVTSATGTAVIVCPGGGFHFLSMEHEGHAVAHYLNSIGVAAFVLKYRLLRTSDDFANELMEFLRDRDKSAETMQQMQDLAGDDGRQAIRVVRAHAAKWGLAPERIGIMGFSAGGLVTLSVILKHDLETRPNFAGSIYAGAFTEVTAPPDPMPLFLLHAGDDRLVAVENSLRLHKTWHNAHTPVEMHVFMRGGHGFGMNKQTLPIDQWPALFRDWLGAQDLLKAARR
jgi:acetyl esterase/lipase